MNTDNSTFVTPAGLVFALAMALLLLVLPRRFAITPILAIVCYMTMGERLMIAGLNFPMIRILVLVGWARLVARWEIQSLKLNRIDIALLLWTASRMLLHNVLWQDGKEFQNTLGGAYDTIGTYFLLRFLLRNMDDIVQAIKIFAYLIGPLAALMLVEKLTGIDPFAAFGGVNRETVVRDGVLRCSGPFLHPILAGTFGAVVLPIFVPVARQPGRGPLVAAIGVISAVIIVLTSGSSGPVLACLSGILGLCMWPMRRHLRIIRWGMVLTLIGLHLVMKSPVWFVLAKVSVFSASDNWHRAFLIDRAIANFGEWWFCGVKDTGHWGSHLDDVTNQFVNQGTYGGFLTMVLFIVTIARCCGGIGTAVRRLGPRSLHAQYCWAMGAALLAHVVTFMSVSYFDQNEINWYFLLAMISTATSSVLAQRKPSAKDPSLGPRFEKCDREAELTSVGELTSRLRQIHPAGYCTVAVSPVGGAGALALDMN